MDDDERSTIEISDGAGGPERNIINESGLYALILRSNKPEAKRFRKWVTSEVLPSIRKTGMYVVFGENPASSEGILKGIGFSDTLRISEGDGEAFKLKDGY